MGTRHRIARLAIALCVLSVVGPWLHVAVHDHLIAHHHDALGRTVTQHDHDPIGTAFAEAQLASTHDGVARLVAPGSLHELTHDQVAVAISSLVITRPLMVDQAATLVATRTLHRYDSRLERRASARGPPHGQVASRSTRPPDPR